MERIVKGIWVPIEIWQDTDLSWNEKVLLMDIDSFTSRGKECYISNEYICNLLGVAERTARQYVSHLIERGLVRLVRFDGRVRYLESALPSLPGRPETDCRADRQKSAGQMGENLPDTNTSNLNQRTKKERGINTPKEKTSFDFYKALINAGVTAETATAWLQVRKAKRCVNSEIAWQATQNEINKSGHTAEHCIRASVERSWAGFKAEWLQREERESRQAQPEKSNMQQIYERMVARANGTYRPGYTYDPKDDLPDEQ